MRLERFSFPTFLIALEQEKVLVDFDARSGHNHGTKFRLRQDCLPMLYETAAVIVPRKAGDLRLTARLRNPAHAPRGARVISFAGGAVQARAPVQHLLGDAHSTFTDLKLLRESRPTFCRVREFPY